VAASDRDHPQVRSVTPLAWPVDQVFVMGDYLVELTSGQNRNWYWSYGASQPVNPVLRVARSAEPDRILAAYVLSNSLPVLGATVKEGKLYLAQA